jgi:hypothetical protein
MSSHFEGSSNPSHPTKEPTFQAIKLKKVKIYPHKEFLNVVHQWLGG